MSRPKIHNSAAAATPVVIAAMLLLIPSAWAQVQGDIALVSMRPVQGIFDVAPLVRDKRTLFELTITSTFATDVDSQTVLFGANARVLDYFPDNPQLLPVFIAAGFGTNLTIHPGTNTYYWPPRFEKADSSDTRPVEQFDVLPPSGQWCPQILVFPLPGGHDANDSNNSASACFVVKGTKAMRVLYVPVTTTGEQARTLHVPTCDEITTLRDRSQVFIRRAYPISEFNQATQGSDHPVRDEDRAFSDTAKCTAEVYGGTFPLNTLDYPRLMKSLADLTLMGGYAETIGVVRDGFIGANLGIGGAVGVAAIASPPIHSALIELAQPGYLTAQEMAHGYGWVPSGYPLECLSTNPTDKNHLCNVPAPGYSVEERRTIPDSIIDFMHPVASLSQSRWISKPSYDYLLSQFRDNPDPEVIALRGIIFSDGTSQFDPWYQLQGEPDIPLGQTGRLNISYRDGVGLELAHTALDLDFEPTHATDLPSALGVLSVRIPQVPGTSTIAIDFAGSPLIERSVSANAPAVTVLNPNGGELTLPGDTLDIAWLALPSNGTSVLHYAVLISQDAGQTWTPLAIDLTDTHFSWVVPPNIISHSLLIKVMATDGVRTSEDVSDATFSSSDDITTPEVTGTPARSADSQAGWYNHPVAVSWTGDDHGASGIAFCDPPITYSGPDASAAILKGHCTDLAGNTGTGAISLKYDATVPMITSADEGRLVSLHAPGAVPAFQCTDRTSGVADCRSSALLLDTTTPGAKLYTVTAVDNANNRNTLVVHYGIVYMYVGISPPSTTAKTNHDSSYPVKFALYDAAGIAIGSARATIYVDGIPGTGTGAGVVGNMFKYDLQKQQYVFNLSLKDLAIGVHQVAMRLDDGTTHSFAIQITK